MFQVVAEDVAAFVERDRLLANIDVRFKRVALTSDQVEQYQLPTAPAKATDSRSKAWSGETCQLEALPPDMIADLLRTAIDAEISPAQMAIDARMEVVERRRVALALPAPGAGHE